MAAEYQIIKRLYQSVSQLADWLVKRIDGPLRERLAREALGRAIAADAGSPLKKGMSDVLAGRLLEPLQDFPDWEPPPFDTHGREFVVWAERLQERWDPLANEFDGYKGAMPSGVIERYPEEYFGCLAVYAAKDESLAQLQRDLQFPLMREILISLREREKTSAEILSDVAARSQISKETLRDLPDVINDHLAAASPNVVNKAPIEHQVVVGQVAGDLNVVGLPSAPPIVPVPVWNLLDVRNGFFRGREEELAHLETVLRAPQQGPQQVTVAAVLGMSGVGKTALVAEYAHRHRKEFGIVWWVQAETPSGILESYRFLARRLGVNLEEVASWSPEDVITWMRSVFSDQDRWLLILDNLPGPESLRAYGPTGGGGNVLVTSHYRGDWRLPEKQRLDLDLWSPDEAVQFLLKRSGDSDETAALALAGTLDRLPLALEQVAAYVAASPVHTLAHYLNEYERTDAEFPEKGEAVDHAHRTVHATFKLSIEAISSHSDGKTATILLGMCAFLAPDDIPRDFFTAAAIHMATDANASSDGVMDSTSSEESVAENTVLETRQTSFDDALKLLHTYSLLSYAADTVNMHRLVQAVQRNLLSSEETEPPLLLALHAVAKALPEDSSDPANWDTWARLAPHALTVTSHVHDQTTTPETLAEILFKTASYQFENRFLDSAQTLYKRALGIEERVFGPEDHRVAGTLVNLGRVEWERGDLDAAIVLLERALGIFERVFGPEDHRVAGTLVNLGRVEGDRGDLDAAIVLLERALGIFERVFGLEDHRTWLVRAVLDELGEVQGGSSRPARGRGGWLGRLWARGRAWWGRKR